MATKTWIGGQSGHEHEASYADNWSPSGVPGSDDDVVIDSNATDTCVWEVSSGTVKSFTIAANCPSGVHFNPTSSLTIAGDFAINAPYGTTGGGALLTYASVTLTIGGNFTMAAGSFHETGGYMNVTMTGTGKVINIAASALGILTLTISGTITASALSAGTSCYNIVIDADKTLTLGANQTLMQVFFWGAVFTNNGSVIGDATNTIRWYMGNQDLYWNPGKIIGAIALKLENAETYGDRIAYLSAHTAFTGSLTISGGTQTIELSHGFGGDANHTLSTGALTLGAKAKMTQGTGAWRFASYTQSGANSVFDQNAAVNCSGDWKVTAGTYDFNGNTVTVGGNIRTTGTVSWSSFVTAPRARVRVDSGTLTVDSKMHVMELEIEAGATCVQSAGVRILATDEIRNAGTFTRNSPHLVVVYPCTVVNPPVNLPINRGNVYNG